MQRSKNGNVIENYTEYFYKKSDRVRVPDFAVENVYNPDGIAVKSEFKKYVQELDDVVAGHQSVKKGLQKLAVKAGILSSEQEIK